MREIGIKEQNIKQEVVSDGSLFITRIKVPNGYVYNSYNKNFGILGSCFVPCEVLDEPLISKEEKFKAMQDGWKNSQSWEQGHEGPSATDRGSYKHGFLDGIEWAIEKMKGEER